MMSEEQRYKEAKAEVEELKGFYWHLLAFVGVNITLFAINLVTSPGGWWFYWVTVFWGIALLWHGISVYGGRHLMGKDWEEKKIQEIMERDKK
jgi:hypothetical protein